MSANTRYSRLPEDNRPSIDSIHRDDQQLLEPDYNEAIHEEPTPPNKEDNLKFTYYPTFYARVLSVILYICSFAIFIASGQLKPVPAIVFLSFAIIRQIYVLYFHVVDYCLIRIHIEFLGRNEGLNEGRNERRKERTVGSKLEAQRPDWLKNRLIQIAIDWVFIIILTFTSAAANLHNYGWYQGGASLVFPGAVACWFAVYFHALSSFDMGKPDRITNTVSFDYGKEKGGNENILPRIYRDVEASGAFQGDMTHKTGADSPPVIL